MREKKTLSAIYPNKKFSHLNKMKEHGQLS